MYLKKTGVFSLLLLLFCAALFSSCSADPAVQLKKITADVKEVVLYANQAGPAVVNLSPSPEDASLEDLTVIVKKEEICTAVLDGTQLLVSPAAAGKTSVSVTDGKKKLVLPVKVLEPVTGLSLTVKGKAVPGGKLTFTPAVEPKNAADRQVEWSLEGGDGFPAWFFIRKLRISEGTPSPGSIWKN
ncbi:MAG: hypothetical protein J6U01_11820 [Clostridia bacterium]|nr:hypothetical protein [Clostridia bacterium]